MRRCGVADGQPDGPVAEIGHEVQAASERLDVAGDDLVRGPPSAGARESA